MKRIRSSSPKTKAKAPPVIMKAKVIAPVSINEVPKKVGEIVDVDANTLENLVRKGRLEAVAAEKESAASDEKTGKSAKEKTK